MFSSAREQGVEGIVLLVRYADASSTCFVVGGRMVVYKLLTYRGAGEVLEALRVYAGLVGRPVDEEQQSQILINVNGSPQLWRIYVIPGAYCGRDFL